MPAQQPVTPAYDLGHYVRPLSRHRFLLAVVTLLGLTLGVASLVIVHPTYTSTVSVNANSAPALTGQLTSANTTTGRTTGSVNPDTEAQIIRSTEVAGLVQAALHSTESPGAIRKRVSVTVPANSTVFKIACTGHSASNAQQCASAYGRAYLSNRATTEKAAIDSQLRLTTEQITAARTTLSSITGEILAAPKGSARRSTLYLQQNTQDNLISSLTLQHAQLATTVISPGTVISAATSGTTSQARRLIPALSGLLIGLILGLAAVALRERFDRNARNADDLERAGLAMLAELRPTGQELRSEYVARTRFDQRVAGLITSALDQKGGVIYIAPVSPGQLRDGVAKRLVGTLAMMGRSAVVLPPGADPSVLSDRLTSPGVDVGLNEHNANLVAGSVRSRISEARQRHQFVIIEGISAVTDLNAYVIADLSDLTVLVIDPEVTQREDLAGAVEQVSVSHSRLLGGVIVYGSRHRRGAAPATFTGNDAPGGRRRSSPASAVDAGR